MKKKVKVKDLSVSSVLVAEAEEWPSEYGIVDGIAQEATSVGDEEERRSQGGAASIVQPI